MDDFQILLNKSFRFLSFRPRSEKEVREYLAKKTFLSKALDENEKKQIETKINLVIEKLKDHKFLNDVEFTKLWIQHRKRKGIRFIKFELKQKGIDKNVIDEVLQNPDLELESDFDKALELAQKRIEKYQKFSRQKIYEKLGRFLVSKGFDFDVIKKVIDQVLTK